MARDMSVLNSTVTSPALSIGPVRDASAAVQPVALASPANHLNQLMLRAVAPNRGSVLAHIAVLAGATLVLTALSVRRLSRVEHAARCGRTMATLRERKAGCRHQ